MEIYLDSTYKLIHALTHVFLPFRIHLTPDDTRWVGAWWVGFIVASVLFVIAAIPISMYGQELPCKYFLISSLNFA